MSDYTKGLPYVDQPVVRMLRLLAPNKPGPLASLPSDERAAIMSSLCLTLMRATYHRLRFEGLVDAARVRAQQNVPHLVMDTLGKFIAFEALGNLVAARSAVDEIAYLAARRAGESSANADKFSASVAVLSTTPSYPEVGIIRATYLDWFKDVNEFRNALAHRGYQESLGVHAVGAPHRQALDPEWNVLLLPDRASICRPRRPHEWSYTEGRRLETLVADVNHGIVCLLKELGTTLWGGNLPKPGAAELHEEPQMIVVQMPE